MTESPPRRAVTWAFVLLAMTFPTAMALFYFLMMGGTGKPNPAQQAAYAGGKTIQFALPVVFVALIARRWPRWQPPRPTGMLLGIAFGVAVLAAMCAAYFGWLRTSGLLAQAPGRIRAKLDEFGIGSPATFLSLAAFLCVAHSFLEEYYWRWFVFGQLKELLPLWPAVVLSSAGFMSHHVLIVYAYLPDRILTGVVPASLAVAVGGAVWAWLYHRAGSLLAPWVSHAIIDSALFIIGWDMLFRT